jgi:hypothetical protein
MIQLDNLPETAEELRRNGLEAFHENPIWSAWGTGGPGRRRGLLSAVGTAPAREPGSLGAIGFRGHQGSPRPRLVGGSAQV